MTDSKRTDMLIVDDVTLLLMDDDGASIQGARTLYYTLGGALLTDLALLDRVELDGSSSMTGPRVTAVGEGPLPDPLLQWAYDTVAEKPQRVQSLLVTLGGGLHRVVPDRLVERGLLRREERKWLGVFRTTRMPATDGEHEARLRARIRRVLVDGEEPDARTAAIIGLLSASGGLPTLRPPLPWTGTTATRAKGLERGEWGAAAVGLAVSQIAAASNTAVALSLAAGSE